MMGLQVPARFFSIVNDLTMNILTHIVLFLSVSFFPTYLSIAGGEISRNVIARSKYMFFFNFISYC